jgi:hypothetical protein
VPKHNVPKNPPYPFTKGGKQVWNFGHCILRFVWDLGFVIWDLTGCFWEWENQENLSKFFKLNKA